MSTHTSDEKDRRIIELLRDNARMSYSEIGEEIGLSRVAVRNRIISLEEQGIITGYHAAISLLAEPEKTAFYAYCETEPQKHDLITEQLRREDIITVLLRVSGNNALMMLCVGTSRQREEFAKRIRNSYVGITYFSLRDIWSVEKGDLLP